MEITATVRLCEGEGEPVVETRCFRTLPSGLEEMVAWLTGHGVEAPVMEGTGVYWQAPFEALEVAGIEAILMHARQMKQLKGRKTDVADSVWLVDEPVPGCPKRPVARNETAAKELKARTLTNLYNARPQWLADAHASLDAAVAGAHGWDAGISNDDALSKLLALSLGGAGSPKANNDG